MTRHKHSYITKRKMQRFTLKYILRLITIAVTTFFVVFGGIIFGLFVQSLPTGRRTQAWWWHRHHGATATYDNYSIPVPQNWVVEPPMGEVMVVTRLYPSGPPRPWGNGFIGQINLRRTTRIQDVDEWSSAMVTMLTRLGDEPQVLPTIYLDGERMSCLEARSVDLVCATSEIIVRVETFRNLRLKTGDSDFREAWDIVTGIRRKSGAGAKAPTP